MELSNTSFYKDLKAKPMVVQKHQTKGESLLCPFCYKHRQTKETLISHIEVVHLQSLQVEEEAQSSPTQMSLICGICLKTYLNVDLLYEHIWKTHQEKGRWLGNYCKLCGDSIPKGWRTAHFQLKHHMIKCSLCSVEFSRYLKYARHSCFRRSNFQQRRTEERETVHKKNLPAASGSQAQKPALILKRALFLAALTDASRSTSASLFNVLREAY